MLEDNRIILVTDDDPRLDAINHLELVASYNTHILDQDSSTVPIGIDGFNFLSDILIVYQNSVFIAVNDDYTFDDVEITKVEGEWAEGTVFNFMSLGLNLDQETAE